MRAKTLIIVMLLLASLMVFLTGCTRFQNKSLNNNQGMEEKAEEKFPSTKPDPITEQVNNMTLEEKIGQMVIVGFEGYTLDDKIKELIEKHHVGGLILFGRNIKDPVQLLALINSLKTANTNNKVPLFISVDEEGGRISRMPNQLKKLPTNKRIGRVNNEEFAYQIGGILAEEIKSFGFNLNFAPVLDIDSNPKNPVIGDRAFSSDPGIVSRLGIQVMKGIQAGVVIPVVKHFPGHGDTVVDSHIGLPSLNHSLERLHNFELIPFKDAINNQADAVMIAHILLNKVDKENPASLSKRIVTDLLRKELNFDGIVITDDLTMGAITKNYSLEDAAVKAVNAGSDIILVCHGYNNELSVIGALKKAVEEGSISKERVDESVTRILKLKSKYNLSDKQIKSVDLEKINSKINTVLDLYLN